MANAKVNYTVEQVEQMKADYLAGLAAGKTNKEITAEIAEGLGKTARSVISKLSREGVYQREEKAKAAPRDEGPSKVELVETLEGIIGVQVETLMNVNKADLQTLIDALGSDESDETEAA